MAPTTKRGRQSQRQIVVAAAELFDQFGVCATSVDDVIARAGVSKSQLYHYFESKDQLARAVVVWQSGQIVAAVTEDLDSVNSWAGLREFFDNFLAFHVAHDCTVGCPLGNLAAELGGRDTNAVLALVESVGSFEDALRAPLDRLQENGSLSPEARPARLASAILAAMQGGLLLAKATGDSGKLGASLDAAFVYVQTFATSN